MPLFDAYLMVDWSAASSPNTGKDSIWWALLQRHDGAVRMIQRENPATRNAATADIADQLARLAGDGARVLAGFDFPFGYPDGTACRMGLPDGLSWRHLWQELADLLDDAPDNANNRFDVAEGLNRRMTGSAFPFWGNVREETRDCLLRAGRPPHGDGDLAEWRLCDIEARPTSSVWKLAYPGSVGSQVLTGIPRVLQLRTDPRLAMVSLIWPFETGLTHDPRPRIIFAEIYPSIVDPLPEPDFVKDARQVRTIAMHFADLDAAGDLGALFEGGGNLSATQRRIVEREEAWILGT